MKKIFSLLLLSLSLFSQSWQQYPYTPPGSVLTFPEDDGAHLDTTSVKTEWWYLNAHLKGTSGKQYHLMLCYFRAPVEMRIFNISNSTDSIHTFDVTVFPDSSRYDTTQWGIFWSIGTVKDTSIATYPFDNRSYKYYYHATDTSNNNEVKIYVQAVKPPLIVGGNGKIPLGNSGDSSYYYTYSRMSVSGTLKFQGQTDSIVEGIAWIDRQWGNFIVGIAGNDYEWFSFQTDTLNASLNTPVKPFEVNVWQIFADSFDVPYSPDFRASSMLLADNTQDTSSKFIFERTKYLFYPPEQTYFSASWRYIDPEKNICLEAEPLLEDQIVDVLVFRFWEGPVKILGTVQGLPAQGLGFAELVTKKNYQVIPPDPPGNPNISLQGNYYKLSWNSSLQGTFPVAGYRIYRAPVNAPRNIQYLATVTDTFFIDTAGTLLQPFFYYYVSAFDNQTATSASPRSYPVSIPLNINSLNVQNFLKIYPVIFNTEVHVNTENSLVPYELIIRNVLGQKIKKFLIPYASYNLNLQELPKGMYFLQAKTLSTNRIIGYGKIVKY